MAWVGKYWKGMKLIDTPFNNYQNYNTHPHVFLSIMELLYEYMFFITDF